MSQPWIRAERQLSATGAHRRGESRALREDCEKSTTISRRPTITTSVLLLSCAAAALVSLFQLQLHTTAPMALIGNDFEAQTLSPGRVDRPANNKIRELKLRLARLEASTAPRARRMEPRGGLEEPSTEKGDRTDEDSLLCAIPGMADTLGSKCARFNEDDDHLHHGKQRARPLMPIPTSAQQGAIHDEEGEGGHRTQVVNGPLPGTVYPYEKSSPIGQLESNVRSKVRELLKHMEEGHNGDEHGGLREPISAGKGDAPTREEEDAMICAIPVLAELFPHLCVGVNSDDDEHVHDGKQRYRPLMPVPTGSEEEEETHMPSDDRKRRAINGPV
eukprot:CAMPEP_0181317428 /NCGR_PEP_ID=MMETSP1101-20121128/16462_1 /TAXON_ID=46948 /ORGANISM="Rhodomonas abbreviata, Strain Caron Lab Isolate" /LENGTH=331 /DNA_ID=CAMNT_0023424819 /DNA_START=83 /DNA_END=1075 /DNA_ORIENTATION=+